MTASIIILTYNRLETTQKTLESVFKNTDYPYRIIFVDNGSTDGTIEWLKALPQDNPFCQGYDFIFNEKNMGVPGGRNIGIEFAKKYEDEWISILDNDIEVPVGWLKECVEIMQVNPKLAMGVNMEGVSYPLLTRSGKTFQVKSQGNLGGACLVFPRFLHDTLGYFSMEYSLYGEEDADFFFRARVKGWELGYIKENGIHLGEGTLDSGEYRKFKDDCRTSNLPKFYKNCGEYARGQKSCYIPFKSSQ